MNSLNNINQRNLLNPTQFALQLTSQINMIRNNPLSAVPYLENYIQKYDGKKLIISTNIIMMTYEGVQGVIDAIQYLKLQKSVKNLQKNDQLCQFAQETSQIIGSQGGSGKVGYQSINNLIIKNNYKHQSHDFYGLKDSMTILIDMIIDDGNTSKSNRRNLFNPLFDNFGTGISFHQNKELISYLILSQDQIIQIQQKNDYPTISSLLLEQINQVRTNPLGIIPKLKNILKNLDHNNSYKKIDGQIVELEEGPNVIQETISFLIQQSPIAPLVRNTTLDDSSLIHAKDLGDNGLLQHESSNGQSLIQRLKKIDHKDYSLLSELIDVEEKDPEEILLKWLFCDGDISRENRIQIFKEQYKLIGIGGSKHAEYDHIFVVNLSGDMIKTQQPQFKSNIKIIDQSFDDFDDQKILQETSVYEEGCINQQSRLSGQYNNLRNSNFSLNNFDYNMPRHSDTSNTLNGSFTSQNNNF